MDHYVDFCFTVLNNSCTYELIYTDQRFRMRRGHYAYSKEFRLALFTLAWYLYSLPLGERVEIVFAENKYVFTKSSENFYFCFVDKDNFDYSNIYDLASKVNFIKYLKSSPKYMNAMLNSVLFVLICAILIISSFRGLVGRNTNHFSERNLL